MALPTYEGSDWDDSDEDDKPLKTISEGVREDHIISKDVSGSTNIVDKLSEAYQHPSTAFASKEHAPPIRDSMVLDDLLNEYDYTTPTSTTFAGAGHKTLIVPNDKLVQVSPSFSTPSNNLRVESEIPSQTANAMALPSSAAEESEAEKLYAEVIASLDAPLDIKIDTPKASFAELSKDQDLAEGSPLFSEPASNIIGLNGIESFSASGPPGLEIKPTLVSSEHPDGLIPSDQSQPSKAKAYASSNHWAAIREQLKQKRAGSSEMSRMTSKQSTDSDVGSIRAPTTIPKRTSPITAGLPPRSSNESTRTTASGNVIVRPNPTTELIHQGGDGLNPFPKTPVEGTDITSSSLTTVPLVGVSISDGQRPQDRFASLLPLSRFQSPTGRPHSPVVGAQFQKRRSQSPMARSQSPIPRPESSIGQSQPPTGGRGSPVGRHRSPVRRPQSSTDRPQSSLGRPASPTIAEHVAVNGAHTVGSGQDPSSRESPFSAGSIVSQSQASQIAEEIFSTESSVDDLLRTFPLPNLGAANPPPPYEPFLQSKPLLPLQKFTQPTGIIAGVSLSPPPTSKFVEPILISEPVTSQSLAPLEIPSAGQLHDKDLVEKESTTPFGKNQPLPPLPEKTEIPSSSSAQQSPILQAEASKMATAPSTVTPPIASKADARDVFVRSDLSKEREKSLPPAPNLAQKVDTQENPSYLSSHFSPAQPPNVVKSIDETEHPLSSKNLIEELTLPEAPGHDGTSNSSHKERQLLQDTDSVTTMIRPPLPRKTTAGSSRWSSDTDTSEGRKESNLTHSPIPAAANVRPASTENLRAGQEEKLLPPKDLSTTEGDPSELYAQVSELHVPDHSLESPLQLRNLEQGHEGVKENSPAKADEDNVEEDALKKVPGIASLQLEIPSQPTNTDWAPESQKSITKVFSEPSEHSEDHIEAVKPLRRTKTLIRLDLLPDYMSVRDIPDMPSVAMRVSAYQERRKQMLNADVGLHTWLSYVRKDTHVSISQDYAPVVKNNDGYSEGKEESNVAFENTRSPIIGISPFSSAGGKTSAAGRKMISKMKLGGLNLRAVTKNTIDKFGGEKDHEKNTTQDFKREDFIGQSHDLDQRSEAARANQAFIYSPMNVIESPASYRGGLDRIEQTSSDYGQTAPFSPGMIRSYPKPMEIDVPEFEASLDKPEPALSVPISRSPQSQNAVPDLAEMRSSQSPTASLIKSKKEGKGHRAFSASVSGGGKVSKFISNIADTNIVGQRKQRHVSDTPSSRSPGGEGIDGTSTSIQSPSKSKFSKFIMGGDGITNRERSHVGAQNPGHGWKGFMSDLSQRDITGIKPGEQKTGVSHGPQSEQRTGSFGQLMSDLSKRDILGITEEQRTTVSREEDQTPSQSVTPQDHYVANPDWNQKLQQMEDALPHIPKNILIGALRETNGDLQQAIGLAVIGNS